MLILHWHLQTSVADETRSWTSLKGMAGFAGLVGV